MVPDPAIRHWRILYAVEIVETSVFTRQVVDLIDEEEYRRFQWQVAKNPELGVVIPGGGGIRKARVQARSHGKRGGARVIYYWAVRHNVILMLFAYAKNATADLTHKQAGQLGRMVKLEFGDGSKVV